MDTPSFSPPQIRDIPLAGKTLKLIVGDQEFTCVTDGQTEFGELIDDYLSSKENAPRVKAASGREVFDVLSCMQPLGSSEMIWEYTPPEAD